MRMDDSSILSLRPIRSSCCFVILLVFNHWRLSAICLQSLSEMILFAMPTLPKIEDSRFADQSSIIIQFLLLFASETSGFFRIIFVCINYALKFLWCRHKPRNLDFPSQRRLVELMQLDSATDLFPFFVHWCLTLFTYRGFEKGFQSRIVFPGSNLSFLIHCQQFGTERKYCRHIAAWIYSFQLQTFWKTGAKFWNENKSINPLLCFQQ